MVFLAWWMAGYQGNMEIKGTHPYPSPSLLSPLVDMWVGSDLVWRCVGIFTVAVFKSEEKQMPCTLTVYVHCTHDFVRLNVGWRSLCLGWWFHSTVILVSPHFLNSQRLCWALVPEMLSSSTRWPWFSYFYAVDAGLPLHEIDRCLERDGCSRSWQVYSFLCCANSGGR